MNAVNEREREKVTKREHRRGEEKSKVKTVYREEVNYRYAELLQITKNYADDSDKLRKAIGYYDQI